MMQEEERLRTFLTMMDALPAPTGTQSTEDAPGGVAGLLGAALSALTVGNGHDERAALLRALRPFLSSARSERVDGAITAMRLADVVREAVYGEANHG